MHTRIGKPFACSITLAFLCLVALQAGAQWIPLNPMLQATRDGWARTFRFVLVGNNHGTGVSASPRPDRVVTYGGSQLLVTLKAR